MASIEAQLRDHLAGDTRYVRFDVAGCTAEIAATHGTTVDLAEIPDAEWAELLARFDLTQPGDDNGWEG